MAEKIIDHAKNARAFIADEAGTDWHNTAVAWQREKRDVSTYQIRILKVTPAAIMRNPLNVWGRQRELPPSPAESFKDWYRKNRI